MGPSKRRTKAEQARFYAIKAGPCLACMSWDIDVIGQGVVEVHHLLSGGRRIGHMDTIGLCLWHHKGQPMFEHTMEEMRTNYGPSLAEGSKLFHMEFGSDDWLLRTQNLILKQWANL